jgi:hypothetical protein
MGLPLVSQMPQNWQIRLKTGKDLDQKKLQSPSIACHIEAYHSKS